MKIEDNNDEEFWQKTRKGQNIRKVAAWKGVYVGKVS